MTQFVPDVAFVSREQRDSLSREERQEPPFAPLIVVEVRSPSDRIVLRAAKIERYLATGSVLVLDVDPEKRTIAAHSADGVSNFSESQLFRRRVAPWLVFAVKYVFADLDD
ncbi:MAG TPA: Uma2 family endonuclease [Verrucomicrobiae bacterium]|jgi:Uma2 family endonuclease|nr:Uma2 family endonuclease [Verrucomicrobiae bacterium]